MSNLTTTKEALDIIDNDMIKVEELLATTITDSNLEKHVNDMCQYVVRAGGKRLRPRLVLMIARALPHFKDEYMRKAYAIAASLELLHTATLIHDDVIDVSPVRRGQLTLHEKESNHVAVLAGDYLFTRCFTTLDDVLTIDLILSINKTLATLVSGEIFQLEHQGDLNISIEDYEQIIYCKTGALFEICSYAFAQNIGESNELVETLKEFGRRIGSAFQVIDDVLDYCADQEALGKAVGEDLEDKRITLPLIFTLHSLEGSDKEDFIKAVDEVNLEKTLDFMKKANAFDKSISYAKESIEKAKVCLNSIEDGMFKDLLLELCNKIIDRNK